MDPEKNKEMQRAFNYYRNNLTGEPPAGTGDDLYNDRVDNIHVDEQHLTNIGNDEAGNPIMANPVNMPSEPEPIKQGVLGNIMDFAAESLAQPPEMPSLPAGIQPLADAARYLYDFSTASDEERKKMTLPYLAKSAAKDYIHGLSNATELEHSQLYESFFYSPNKKNEEIKRISDLLGFDVSNLANDRELWVKAALAAERVERMGKFKKYQDAYGNMDMAKIYADIPGLAEIQKNNGTAAAAMVLGNMDGMQTINDVYDNAFTRFFGSIYTGGRRAVNSFGKSWEWGKAMLGARMPSKEEQAEIDEYDAVLRNLPRYNYNSVTGTAGAMLGGAAENAAMMIISRIPHVVEAVATKGRLQKVADVAGVGIMAAMIAPQQYEELVTRTDENGKPVYTPEQARMIAIAQAVPQAVLEDYSLRRIGGAIFGKSTAPALSEIIKKSASLEAAKAGVKEYASVKIRESIKAGAISLGAEAAEEFEQAFSDRIVENVAQVLINGREADVKSLDTILQESTGEMLEALSAIGGFGLIGFLGHPIANTRAALNFRSRVRQVVNDTRIQGAMQNAHYTEVLNGVWANKQNIKELQDKAPEVVSTLLDAQNRKAGMEYGFVDVKMLAQQEGGQELVKQIAQANNISADELAVCMDGSGMLQVKTSTLMQMDLQDNQKNAITDNLTTSLDAVTRAQHKEALQIASTQLKDLQAYEDKTYKQSVDNIIAARFPDTEQARLAREIIEANYENPQAEFKRRLDAVNAEINEKISPILKTLQSGMKQGVEIVRMEGERDAKYVRMSNNDQWYSNYYADYGRAPSNEGLINLAIDIAAGRQDPRYIPSELMSYQNNTDETRQYFAREAAALDKLEEERDALRAIKDRMQELRPSEMAATATLSKEGLEVYDAAIRWMGTSNNEKVQKAGRLNALLLARYADNMAKVFSRIKQKPYTAKDFIRERLKIDVNAVQEEKQNAAQMFQVSPAEFERQKAEVRKQYKGTDGWLKAPNGKDTNLTEDQWVTVRTPAFKNWFGDWENDPGNASKIVDENGEPRPFYHGTQRMDRVGDTFLPERATSGPMAFFTSSKEIATNYSKDKIDTSLQREASEYKDQFTVALPNGKKVNIVDYWNHLSTKEKNAIRKTAGHVTFDDEADNIISDPDVNYGVGDLEYKIKNSNGNVLQALVDEWLTDGNIWGSEEKFLDVLKLAGVKADVEYLDPNKVVSGVFEVYLNVHNPFNTDNIDEQFIKDLEEASKTAKEYQGNVSDMWDKGRQTPAQFVERVKSDYEAGTTHAWTSIPDWVTDLLKSKGHDGILDKGGKNGGQIHDVAIPFASNQIKDATGRNVGFDPQSGNIYLQEAWHGTPSTFKRFSTDFMGTGEGNQAHGWGLYFAQDKEIADSYRRNLTLNKNENIDEIDIDGNKYYRYEYSWQDDNGNVVSEGTRKAITALIDNNFDVAKAKGFIEEQIRREEANNENPFFDEPSTDNTFTDALAFLNEIKDQKKLKSENKFTTGSLFKTDIPENDVLLDEQKSYDEQSEHVKKALNKLLNDYHNRYHYKFEGEYGVYSNEKEYVVYDGDREVTRFENEDDASLYVDEHNYELSEGTPNFTHYNSTGQEIYEDLSDMFGGDKAASLKLNEYGIKGITYNGYRDGRCFVVFDDKAISILNKYYQQQNRLKGSITENDRGQRLISLFEGADQSTFVHEMAHMFLMDLQEIAGIDPNGREAKDLKTIMDWAQYRPGQSDEYKGTSSEAEFKSREEAIKAAVAAGNMQEAERLKNVWAQERFARGFEEYLRTGEAPARGLKYAFRQFKKWLMNIYRDVTGAGVRATPEVEAIMARMIASDEEIEALAAANNIARLKKLDPDILTDDAAAMRERWKEEGKEKAKEKMLRQLVKQYEQQNLKDMDKRLEEVRMAATLELQNVPCFVCEELLAQGNSLETALDICEFGSDADSLEKREEMYKEALYAAGGSLKQAVEREVSLARAQMLEAMPSQEELYKMAEEALNSGEYNARLSELEAQILQAREKAYNEIPTKLQAAFTDLDGSLGDLKKESWEAVKKKIQELKYAERWKAEEFAMLKEFEDAAAKLDPDDKEAVDRLLKEYQRIKDMVVRNKDWVRGVRDATKGQVEALRLKAQAQMDRQPISAATNPRHWQRQAFAEGKAAWDALSKSQGKGIKNGTIEYRNAISAKMQQALYDFMTALAIKNRKELDKMLNGRDGIYNRARRMADPKYKADATMRYFHNHILYIMGLRNADAIAPAKEKTFTELLAELRQAQEFDEEIPAWMIQLAEAKQPLDKNYQTLTMEEFRQLKKLTDVLYTLARNKNRLLTLDMDMDTARAEIREDFENHTDYEVGNQRINEIKGDIGEKMNSLLKAEQILSILGGKQGGFIKYIYRILFNAAEAEEKALEQEAAAEKALYGMYTHEELRAMVNDPVMVEGKDGTRTKLQIGEDTDITKEHLICMALNWGNKLNRARLIVGLFDSVTSSDIEIRSNELMQILQTHLTKKDWAFVQAMWNIIGSFADPVSGVLEKSLGVPLDRVKAEVFTVTLPDGETLEMQGGYYPIVKDSGKSSRQSEFEQMEEARQIAGAAVFGAGMGQTKNRSANEKLNQGPLKLSLDVASRHIKAQIHLVHARMAVRDAYKVLNDAAVKDMIERTCGTETFKTLNEYVLNCWAPPIQPHHWLEKYAAKLRGKTVSAIMAYRTMTSLLNTLPNVVYMAQEIGTGNALAAIADFYKDWRKNREMILELSVFMRNRATNMDRDLNAQQEKFLNRHEGMTGKMVNAIDKVTGGKTAELDYLINKYANKLIEETDMMVSMPLYKWQFNQTYSEEIAKGVPAEEARETANFEATRRVTKVFGSSRAVDASAVQRSRNEFVKLLTPFFSFANTMMNAVWSKHFEQKLQGKNFGNEKIALRDSKGNVLLDEEGNIRYTTEREQHKLLFRYRYGKFVRAVLMNYLLGALVETWMRQLPDALAGTGDDDDDEDKIGVGVFKVGAKEYAKNVISGAAAGFPGINMMADTFNTYVIEGKMYGNRGVGVVSGSVDRYVQVGKDLLKITQGSDKIDVLDLVRDCVKASNTRTGFSDTLTDAIFNTARFAMDDYQMDNMDDLREYIAKTLFDRKLKKRK